MMWRGVFRPIVWKPGGEDVRIHLAALLVLMTAGPALALEPLPPPQGPVLLVVDGNIAVTNSAEGAAFDRDMLTALGMTGIDTSTAWTDGVEEFEGVLARVVLARVGASGTSVIAGALNDYSVSVPIADFEDYDVVLAMVMNGKEMLVSDKGPIWIVYPRDDHPELQDARFNERWVWQLRELTVQ